jgi:GrpB-like predicted nucleotidyltransferase (UPF0157 family)
VPGLAAKPIIDIMPGLRSLDDAPPIIEALQTIGYQYVPEFERDGPLGEGMPFRRYLRKDREGVRAFHMHMVEFRSDFWRDHLLFRNVLRVRPPFAVAYADLKRKLAAEFNANLRPDSNVNLGYTNHKTGFVLGVLGLARERNARNAPIVVVDYDPEWPRWYEREREAIARVAGDLAVDIQHVGSTSVPGLAAKPLIDIAFGAKDMAQRDELERRLATLGIIRNPNVNFPDWVMFRRYDGGVDALHVHMQPHGGVRWQAHLRFRDRLRADPDAVARYGALKRQLAEEFGPDIIGYTEAKTEFITEIVGDD